MATSGDRQRPGAVERPRTLLPRDQLALGVVEPANRDQCLERVRELQAVAGLEELDVVADLPRALEEAERRGCVSQRELDEAEHAAMARLRDANPVRLRARERPFRASSSFLDSTLVRGDHRSRHLHDGLQAAEAELFPQRERVCHVASRQVPVSGAPLEDAQQPQSLRLLRIVARAQGLARLDEECPGLIELPGPDELEREAPRRRSRRPLRQ